MNKLQKNKQKPIMVSYMDRTYKQRKHAILEQSRNFLTD